MKAVFERYARLLHEVAVETTPGLMESRLMQAYDQGRNLLDQGVSPDEVIHMHHAAILQLAQLRPDFTLAQVAGSLTLPLMEVSMSYGMAFREQMEQRYEAKLKLRVSQSSKLEATGTLAAGIAHDFNNILGSIVGYAEMAADDLDKNSEARKCIEQVLIASFRARQLVASLLTFARQTPVTSEAADVVELIREILALLKASLDPAVQVCFTSAMEHAIVIGDPVQIQQVVMNLCLNAADAMKGKGIIRINLDAAQWHQDHRDEIGCGLCLSVADTGCGMRPEVLARIFDPFFTTKAPGKGSGLGLSVVHGAVTQLGGKVEVDSCTSGPKTGTEFRVYLPWPDAETAKQ